MNTIDIEEIVEAALDILHEAIQHTPIKLEETNGTDYDKGYIFYQDMVVRNVLDNTPKLRKLLTDAFTTLTQHHEAEVERAYERGVADGTDKPLLAIENVREAERERIERDISYIHYNLRNAIRNEKDGLNIKGYENEVDRWLTELSKALTPTKTDQQTEV